MTIVVAILCCLGAWQHEFIWHGIEHNLFVNLAIIGTTVIGIVIAFHKVAKLENEFNALNALKEMWNDIRGISKGEDESPYARHFRALKDGIVFTRPNILGHVYDLVTEEIVRTRDFQINVDIMNTLVHKIEEKLNEERALLNYLAGLLVFMGLVGTFMGLLKMVGSIGGILAGLQATGDGGADGFNRLLSDLQEPLGGMASGFASSLFGLCGSLVVGLLARLANDAASILKEDFEAWLAAAAQIRDEDHDNGVTSSAVDAQVIKMLGTVITDYGRASRGFETAVGLLARVAADQAKQRDAMSEIAKSMEALASGQRGMTGEFAGLGGIAAGLAARFEVVLRETARSTNESLDGMRASLEAMARDQATTASALKTEMASSLAAALSAHVTPQLSDLVHETRSTNEGLDGMRVSLEGMTRDQAAAASALKTEMASSLGAALSAHVTPQLSDLIRETRMADAARRSEAERLTIAHGELRELIASNGNTAAELTRLEAAIATGMNEMSRSTETAFSAYAGLLRDVVAAKAGQPEPVAEAERVKEPPQAPISLSTREFREAMKLRSSTA